MSYLESRANLHGRVAAVIGGAGGIGRAISLALASSGVDIVFCDNDAAFIEPLCAEVQALGRRAVGMLADATDRAELQNFYQLAEQSYERLDIVVNVVGGNGGRRNLLDGTHEDDEGDIRRNYGYIVDSVRFAIPLIRRGGRGGSIINFTTIEAHRGAATFAVYAGAKAATTNFTKAVAVELAAERIRVNTLAPDTTPTKRQFKISDDLGPFIKEGMKMYIPMKQQPPADAVADGVLFLASDLSSFVTGTTLHIDGGTSASMGFIDWPFGGGYMPVPMDGALRRMYTKEELAEPRPDRD